MIKAILITTIAILAALTASILTAQQQTTRLSYVAPSWSPTLQVNQIESSNYPDVTIYASASYAGQPLVGLGKSDFRVREGEFDQQILSVEAQRDPLSVVLLLDVSGSMRGSLTEAQAAAIGFLRTLAPRDRVEVMTFHERIDTLYALGNDFRAAERAIRNTEPLGDTALYDGIHGALSVMEKHEGRRAVIVLSDGVDDDGSGRQLSKNNLEDPILKALVSNIPVYTIGLGNNMDEGVLRTFAGSTGADYLSAPSANQLVGLYQRLGEKLAGQYAIRYRANSVADGSVRGVKLDYVIPSAKPYASPMAVVGDGNVIGYRSPKLDDEQYSRLAYLSGLTNLQRRHQLPEFERVKIRPVSNWPEWLPEYSRVHSAEPLERGNSFEAINFITRNREVFVTEEFKKSLQKEGWDIQSHQSVANVSTVRAVKGDFSIDIAAVHEGGFTKVTAEYEGKEGPIVIGDSRKEQIFNANGRDVIISSAYSKIRILGSCGTLRVTGEGNQIDATQVQDLILSGNGNETYVELLAKARITGDSNKLAWKNGLNVQTPDVTDVGVGNDYGISKVQR